MSDKMSDLQEPSKEVVYPESSMGQAVLVEDDLVFWHAEWLRSAFHPF